MAQQTQAVAPIATQQHWVQCENPNCNKWRLLPAGTVVNENEAWYCYMNPDPDKNTCSASEAEYDENNEVIIDANYEVKTGIVLPKAAIAPAVAALTKPKKKRGRPPSKNKAVVKPVDEQARTRVVSFADEFFDDSEEDEVMPQGQDEGKKKTAKQLVQVLNDMMKKSVESKGPSRGQVPISKEAWEVMSRGAPELTEIACDYADACSSIIYFNPKLMQNTQMQQEAYSLEMQARLAAMLASAHCLQDMAQAMTIKDRAEWEVGDESGFEPLSIEEIIAGQANFQAS